MKSNRLIMLDFYTDWCGYCKKLDQTTFIEPAVVKEFGKVVPVKINAEKEGYPLAKKYVISSFPTLVFIQPDGVEYGRINGYVNSGYFIQSLREAISLSKEIPLILRGEVDE